MTWWKRQYYETMPAPFAAGSETSEEAAASIQNSTGGMRRRLYGMIKDAADGLTCDEIERTLRCRHQTVSARIWELVGGGWVMDCGLRRPTRTGRMARVLKIKEAA